MTICASAVRYIKLGKAGGLESYCIDNSLCYLGFWTNHADVLDRAVKAAASTSESEFLQLRACLAARYPDRDEQTRRMLATSAANQVRAFFAAENDTLWITFYSGKLYYAFLDPSKEPKPAEGHGGCFRSTKEPWSCLDVAGGVLKAEKLSGQVTKIQRFMGTSCEITPKSREYLLRRINAEQHSYITQILKAREQMAFGIEEAIKSLTPQDFELLVDLIFSRTLRRVSVVGKTQKYVDMIYENPLSSGSAAQTTCVQVKSRTSIKQFNEYIEDPQFDSYDSFYYVYHQSADLTEDHAAMLGLEGRVTLLGVRSLSRLVIEAGLVSWVVDKAA
jgi:hypothetical protein